MRSGKIKAGKLGTASNLYGQSCDPSFTRVREKVWELQGGTTPKPTDDAFHPNRSAGIVWIVEESVAGPRFTDHVCFDIWVSGLAMEPLGKPHWQVHL